jgi:hypothetical protein
VVLVSQASDFLLADARAALQRALTCRPQSDPAIVFGYWMLMRPGDAAESMQIATDAMQRSGAQQDFQTVATLGFARESGLLEPEAAVTLKQGLERLAGRSPVVDEIPMPFCSDAVGILGVALGTRSLADNGVSSQIVAWLSRFLPNIYNLDGTENWQRTLFQAVDHLLGSGMKLPSATLSQTEDVRIALDAKNTLPRSDGEQAEQEEEMALKLILAQGATETPYERAAIRLCALEYIVRAAPTVVPGRISAQNLIQLLERFPAGLRNWTWETKPRTPAVPMRKWHVDHEYHVQNMLWFLLAPILPDLDDEQYLTKIGRKSPRADLYIPSMKIIVEAKFLRMGDRIQKIIDEISSDASLYGALGNDCDGIIAFVWDDSARSQEHDYLKQGLKKLKGVIGTVIVSRPSDWNEDSTTQNANPKGKKAKQAPTGPKP